MARAIVVGNFAGNGSLVVNVEELYASQWSLLVTGTAGVFGTLSIKAGTPAVRELLKLTSPVNGVHIDVDMGAVGAYVFTACCTALEFVLAGSTTPDLDLTLFPEFRP